jgi:YidC/Oxa1 family membrane protein insertase
MAIFDYVAEILSIFIRPIYQIVQNYGWTIIIFTILIKLVTLPFNVKSQKSMARMQQVQPLISEVQKKYANNKEKQQEELMKIYDKYEISPTGGCMPMILQLVVLMGFVQIVYRPITFILRIPKATIAAAATELGLESALFTSNQLKVFSYPELLEKLGISSSSLNFNFLGIDLTKVLQQNMSDWKMWILPVLALIFSILSTYVSQRQATKNQNANAKNDPSQAQAAAMTKSMYVMMPLMTIWITFSWPLGCALYWIISTVTQIAQQMFINKFIVSKMDKIDITGKKKKKKKTQVVKDAEIIKDTTQKGENNSEAD